MARPRKEREQSIEVLSSPVRRDLAYIPDSVVRFFAATGKRVSLASADPTHSISLESARGRFPVVVKDFGDQQEEFTELLTRECGFRMKDGMFSKGDCVLFVQSYAAYDDLLAAAAEENAGQYGQDGYESDLGVIDDMLRSEFGAAGGRRPAMVRPDYREVSVMEQRQKPL